MIFLLYSTGIEMSLRPLNTKKYMKKSKNVKFVQGIVGVNQNGSYDVETKEAVKKWQKAHGLKADGKIGRRTLIEMIKLNNCPL